MCKLTSHYILLLMIYCFCLVGNSSAQTQGPLRFAIDHRSTEPLPPYRWFNHCSNNFRGVLSDLYTRLATDLGREPVFVEAPPASSLLELMQGTTGMVLNGDADFTIASPSLTAENKRALMGSQVVLRNRPTIVQSSTAANIDSLKTLESLTGVAVNPEHIINGLSRQGLKLSIKASPSMEQALMDIAQRRADYWITDRHTVHHLAKSLDVVQQLRFSSIEVGVTSRFYLYTQNTAAHAAQLKKIDGLIQRYEVSGYLDYLILDSVRYWIKDKGCLTVSSSR
ncbi:substrate-binding periplasmic protein [Oceanicoccus sagamiensis]|nr:transporter substrate-binding domain-containing protein [Oceanicoccus sagamiensis]